MKHYFVNEVFYSVQGEGVRAGTANVFVRFSGCNLSCKRDGEAGFDCDTEFTSGRRLTTDELLAEMAHARETHPCYEGGATQWCILTGGEPLLQVDTHLLDQLHARGWKVAIETNGTEPLPGKGVVDWLCVSPKSAEHTIRIALADEVKYVRHYGQGIPRPTCKATHYLISPAFETLMDPNGLAVHRAHPGSLSWCIKLVKEHPTWRLSVQQHKAWGVR